MATPKRNMRIPDTTWESVLRRAEAEGTDATKITNRLLDLYGRELSENAPTADPWDVVRCVMRDVAGGAVGPDTDLELAAFAGEILLHALGIRAAREQQTQ